MSRVLIISPYFPPTNAADMQRVRTSLPYFEKFGWIPEVVCVEESFSDLVKDPLLANSIPNHIKIHAVKAFSKSITSKLGLGSIALRSMWFYRAYVDKLLNEQQFDLIYFSTTQFPICVLGNYWKKKFSIPYVIDMQDPWHSDYYQDKPKQDRPPKYWFSYRLNKYLEPLAMRTVDGLISVSKDYIDTLKTRYPNLENIPSMVIPFGASKIDFQIAEDHVKKSYIDFDPTKINIVYTGAIGNIMKESISLLCKTLSNIKAHNNNLYSQLRIYFIGTSYAPEGTGVPTVMPIAREFDVEDCISEQTNRIGYFKSLYLLKKANALLIIGSDDEAYNPSKIYTYALAARPIIGIFKSTSPAIKTIESCSDGIVVGYDLKNAPRALEHYLANLGNELVPGSQRQYEQLTINSAEELTKKQCTLFNSCIYNLKYVH